MFVPLLPHPSTAAVSVGAIEFAAERGIPGTLLLRYRLVGDLAGLRIPAPAPPQRRDGLWRHTCAEVFLREPGATGYVEVNLSPSGEWAAYGFAAYRENMTPLAAASPPDITVTRADQRMEITCRLAIASLGFEPADADLRLAASVVLEAGDGTLAYWAAWHPAQQPDFHHPDGFALRLTRTDPCAILDRSPS